MKPWLRTLIAYALPVIVIVISIGIMTMEPGRTKRIGSDQFLEKLSQLQQQVQNENWDDAKTNIDNLQHFFKQRVRRLQFSAEREEIRELNLTLAQIEAYIVCKDQTEALVGIHLAREHWDNLDH